MGAQAPKAPMLNPPMCNDMWFMNGPNLYPGDASPQSKLEYPGLSLVYFLPLISRDVLLMNVFD